MDRDLTHLFSGKDLDPNGTVGLGWEPGINNVSHHGQSLSQHINLSAYARSIVVAHEMGHNFFGRHDLAEKFWNPGEDRWEHTMMWNTTYDGDESLHMYPYFSNGARTTDDTLNNRK